MHTHKITLALAALATGLIASTPAQAQTPHTLSPQQRYLVQVPGAQIKFISALPDNGSIAPIMKGTTQFLYTATFASRPHVVFTYTALVGSHDEITARVINAESIGSVFGDISGSQVDGVGTFHNGDWTATMTSTLGGQPICTSARGGYRGRIVMKVGAFALPRRNGKAVCASLSSGRDILYTALVARARG